MSHLIYVIPTFEFEFHINEENRVQGHICKESFSASVSLVLSVMTMSLAQSENHKLPNCLARLVSTLSGVETNCQSIHFV